MLILIHSETNRSNIRENLGKPEYSYYFVLKEFRPLLERLGQVMEISDSDDLVRLKKQRLIGRPKLGRRCDERAVVATVPAQPSQRNEHLGRICNDASEPTAL